MATAIRTERGPSHIRGPMGKSPEGVEYCSRCGGLMVMDQLIDLPSERCVQCGDVVDPVILLNRQRTATIGMN